MKLVTYLSHTHALATLNFLFFENGFIDKKSWKRKIGFQVQGTLKNMVEKMNYKENMMELAKAFCKEFKEVYEFDENKDFVVSESRIIAVEKWFNSNLITIKTTLEIDIGIILFNHDFLSEKGKAENSRIMLNSYAMAYVTNQHFERYLLKQN